MLICVFVYHYGCPGDTGLAVMWQPQCLLKKGKINGVHANRPFSRVYVSAGQMSTNSETICLLGFSTWGPCCSTWPNLDPVLPLPAELRGIRTAQRPCLSLSLSPVCVSGLWILEWQRRDVSCGFYLDAQPEKAFTVWHCALTVSQSVGPSVIQNQSRTSLNKTARQSWALLST